MTETSRGIDLRNLRYLDDKDVVPVMCLSGYCWSRIVVASLNCYPFVHVIGGARSLENLPDQEIENIGLEIQKLTVKCIFTYLSPKAYFGLNRQLTILKPVINYVDSSLCRAKREIIKELNRFGINEI